jgi:hypothetical protein
VRNVLFALGITLVAAISAVVAASATWLFWEAWRGADREAFRAMLGAFSGALFAFLFVRLGEALKRLYERKEKNDTTLIRLQHYFNDCLNITGDNIFIADFILPLIDEQRLRSGDLPVLSNEFHEYPIERELIVGLTNVDFLNDVYTLNVELRKLNDSMATADRSYEQVTDAFLSKKIEPEMYIANLLHSRPRYAEIREYLLETKEDLVRLFATTTVLLRQAPFLVRVIRALTKSRYSKRFEADLAAEIARASADIQIAARKSRERIEKVHRRVAQPGAAEDAPQAARR